MGSKFQEFDKWPVNTGPLNGNLSVALFLMSRLLHNFWAFSYNFQVWEKFSYAGKKKVPVRTYFYLNTLSLLATLITSDLKPNK